MEAIFSPWVATLSGGGGSGGERQRCGVGQWRREEGVVIEKVTHTHFGIVSKDQNVLVNGCQWPLFPAFPETSVDVSQALPKSHP